MPATIRWVALALLGLLIAAGVSIAASSLASQQIGLASEPISAGDALAPAVRAHAKSHRHRPPTRHGEKNPSATTAPSAAYPPAVTTAPPPPTSTAPPPTTSPSPPPTSTPVPPSPGRRLGGGGGDSHGDGGGEGSERGESGHGADD